MPTVKEDILARLRSGPFPSKDCQTLRIARSTLKTTVCELRNDGHVIIASPDPNDTRHRSLYTLVE